MKRLSWPGVMVLAGSTLLSWLAGSPGVVSTTVPRAAIEPEMTAPARTPTGTVQPDSDAAAIASMHLHDWSARLSAHEQRERNIFSFGRSASPPPPPVPAGGGLLEAGSDAKQPALVLFRLIGVAEDAGPDGPTRTAIISGQGQLYLAREGDTVAFIYRVGRISAGSVELLDSTGGSTLRLMLE